MIFRRFSKLDWKEYPFTSSLSGDCITIAYNPIAGSGKKQAIISQLHAELQRAGFSVDLGTDPSTLKANAEKHLHAQRLRGVIAAGGDGTVSFLMNLLPPGVPIAVFPLGTENLLARQIGYSRYPSEFVRLFQTGRIVSFDAALANGRYFTQMASCGFDAEVVRQVHVARQGNIDYGTYFKPILHSIRTYAYPEMKVSWGESSASITQTSDCRWAFISNFPRYAGGLRLSPAAHPGDGELDLCLFKQGNFWPSLRYLYGVVCGRHEQWSDVLVTKSRYVKIESTQPVPYQLDGDSGGWLPLEIHCLSRTLPLIVP